MVKEDFGLYQSQINTDVSFTGFMAAVVMFFTGLLLTTFSSFDILIKVPISFLIISTFGFLYSSLVLVNATTEISQKNLPKAKKHMLLGYSLSEYVGVYLLVLAIPLVINIITKDLFLRSITLISSLLGLSIYQFSHLSMLEKHYKKGYNLISVLIILFGLGLFFAQIKDYYFVHLALLFLIFISYVTYTAIKKSS